MPNRGELLEFLADLNARVELSMAHIDENDPYNGDLVRQLQIKFTSEEYLGFLNQKEIDPETKQPRKLQLAAVWATPEKLKDPKHVTLSEVMGIMFETDVLAKFSMTGEKLFNTFGLNVYDVYDMPFPMFLHFAEVATDLIAIEEERPQPPKGEKPSDGG